MQINLAAIFFNEEKEDNSKIYAALGKALKVAATPYYQLGYNNSREDIKQGTNLLFCLGGDGTLLKAARLSEGKNIKLLGINSGSLGFLAATDAANAANHFDKILQNIINNNFFEQPRMILTTSVRRGGAIVFNGTALNECVVKSHEGRAAAFNAWYGAFIREYFGDGIIIATPTGSTAYSLAAGGPIVHPSLDVFVLTPICGHTLTQRPLVLPAREPIKIKLAPRKHGTQIILSLDGQVNFQIEQGDEITIMAAEQKTLIMFPKEYDFFKTLACKLKWGN